MENCYGIYMLTISVASKADWPVSILYLCLYRTRKDRQPTIFKSADSRQMEYLR